MKRQEVRPRTFLPGGPRAGTAPPSRRPRRRCRARSRGAARALPARPPATASAVDRRAARSPPGGRRDRSRGAAHSAVTSGGAKLRATTASWVSRQSGSWPSTSARAVTTSTRSARPSRRTIRWSQSVRLTLASTSVELERRAGPAPARARGLRRPSRDRRRGRRRRGRDPARARTRPRGERPPRGPGPGPGTPAGGLRRAPPATAANPPVPVRADPVPPSGRSGTLLPAQASAPGRITTRR